MGENGGWRVHRNGVTIDDEEDLGSEIEDGDRVLLAGEINGN